MANWSHLLEVKILYLVRMFVLLHVLVLYVERYCEVWPQRNQYATLDRGSVSYICMVLELHVIPTNLNKCHSIGHFNFQLHWTCLGYYIK